MELWDGMGFSLLQDSSHVAKVCGCEAEQNSDPGEFKQRVNSENEATLIIREYTHLKGVLGN